MARSKQKIGIEKKPDAAATADGSKNNINTTTVNVNTREAGIQSVDLSFTQQFQYNPNNYEMTADTKSKGTHWIFIVYPESAPETWREQLEATGLPFVVSPLHDRDVNPDGSPKKAHYHVIVSYGQAQRYSSVIGLRVITNGPFPIKCNSVSGTYAYLTHRNNPEKAQYRSEEIERFNGWEKQLESHEISVIKRQLTIMCFVEDIREYSEFIVVALGMGGDYESVASTNTFYFDRLISSYRHAPLRTLMRFFEMLETDEERDAVRSRIEKLQETGGKFED